MIIDGANTVDLAVGTDRRQIEPGDAQIVLPSMIMPVLLQLKPTRNVQLATVTQKESAIVTSFVSRTNQAAIATDLLILEKGLWELEITMATSFNYGYVVNSDNGISIDMVYQSFTLQLLKRFSNNGQAVDYNRLRLLLVQPATIQSNVGLTGVGQSADIRTTINAIRIL